MWCAEGVDDPMIAVVMRNQSTDTANRVIDVLWKFVAHFGADFVIGLAVEIIGGSKPAKIRYCLDIPYKDVRHVMGLACVADMMILDSADAPCRR